MMTTYEIPFIIDFRFLVLQKTMHFCSYTYYINKINVLEEDYKQHTILFSSESHYFPNTNIQQPPWPFLYTHVLRLTPHALPTLVGIHTPD